MANRSVLWGSLIWRIFPLVSWGLCNYYLDVHRSLLEVLSLRETNSFVYGWEMIVLIMVVKLAPY